MLLDGISLVKISFENTRFKNIIEKYNKKYYKKIKKAQKAIDYKVAVNSLFAEQEIIKGAGLFSNNTLKTTKSNNKNSYI